ncbi:DUF192 domain-containing protein [Candidatus Giovannonibacteria bacterium]|nr:DUF192 domain-containing protein [Candidatus Giovannonibacteria bacterium]
MFQKFGGNKIILVFILLAFFAFVWGNERKNLFSNKSNETDAYSEEEKNDTSPFVIIQEKKIYVEIVREDVEVKKGLSGRASLEDDHGMLFIFPKLDVYRFWMPDMHFPIDIIWIENGKIIGAEKNVSPEFDPSRPRFYTSPAPVQYVLEVNAGFVEKNGIKTGNSISFYNF